VIPADWPGFSARRTFRGTVYEIEVRRTGPGNAVALEVDGKAIAGDVVPFADRAARVSVTIG
jgi:cellobiose phosphorylase